MFVSFLCVAIAAGLPYVWSYFSLAERARQLGGVDNRHPRLQQAQLQGFGLRAQSASENGFETFPLFAAAIVLAAIAGVEPAKMTMWSLIFVSSRVFHGVFYLGDLEKLRSLSFLIATLANFALFVLALRAVA